MSAEKKATRPGSKWAHGKREHKPAPSRESDRKGYDWHAGARVRRPK